MPNVAGMGRFSSDSAVLEYARTIWSTRTMARCPDFGRVAPDLLTVAHRARDRFQANSHLITMDVVGPVPIVDRDRRARCAEGWAAKLADTRHENYTVTYHD